MLVGKLSLNTGTRIAISLYIEYPRSIHLKKLSLKIYNEAIIPLCKAQIFRPECTAVLAV